MRCKDDFVQLPGDMGDEEAGRAIAKVAEGVALNGRRRTRRTYAVCHNGATGMGEGGGGLAAKRQSLDRRPVSHADPLAELEEKQAKFAEEVEKAGLQEKLDAKKISGSRTQPSRSRWRWRR